MLDDEIFSTKNCAWKKSCGVPDLLFALLMCVCILQPCLSYFLNPPYISWKRHPSYSFIDPSFYWISNKSNMFPVRSRAIFPFFPHVLPWAWPLLVTCLILPYLFVFSLHCTTSCLPHPLRASSRRTQLLKNLQKSLMPQRQCDSVLHGKVYHRSSQVFTGL